MPQETKSNIGEKIEQENQSLQGLVASKEDERALLDALEKAFDYRGDITLHLTDGKAVEGFIFDRRTADSLRESNLRLLPPDSDGKITIRYSDIDRIEFSGKDTAHGKSFEKWVERYVKTRLAGEKASIESESLD